jgi:hypothetical protein
MHWRGAEEKLPTRSPVEAAGWLERCNPADDADEEAAADDDVEAEAESLPPCKLPASAAGPLKPAPRREALPAVG